MERHQFSQHCIHFRGNEKERLVDELVEATRILSQRKTGALITIEQGHSLTDYIKTGKVLNSSSHK
ncbi:diadenylate cyclase [Erysipelothrix sp. D19-032]